MKKKIIQTEKVFISKEEKGGLVFLEYKKEGIVHRMHFEIKAIGEDPLRRKQKKLLEEMIEKLNAK